MCTCSDKDPGGLLLLPEKGDLADMNSSEVLAVMSTLLSVAAREVTGGSSASVLPPSPRGLVISHSVDVALSLQP